MATQTEIDHTAEIKSLNVALEQRRSAFKSVASSVHLDDAGVMHVDTAKRDEAQKIVGEMKDLREEIARHQYAAETGEYLDAPEGKSFAAADRYAEFRARSAGEAKSLGQLYVESDACKDMRAGANRPNFSRSMELNKSLRSLPRGYQQQHYVGDPVVMGQKDVYTAIGGQVTRPAFGAGLDIVEQILRQPSVRDLFPQDTTTTNLIQFLRESGFTNGAATVGERATRDNVTGVETPVPRGTVGGNVFAMKPSSDIQFDQDAAPVVTIAHWIRAHKSVLADEPRLRGLIDTRMMWGLKMEEEAQILAGDGQGENMLGILNVEGVQEYSRVGSLHTADGPEAVIRRALTRVELSQFAATGVVMHPIDWEGIELRQDNTGRYVLTVAVADGAQLRLWQVPVIKTQAIPQGTFLTGAFGLGAKVWDREEANISVSTEDGENFRRNALTILAEERAALEVTRPEAFVIGTF